MNPILAFLLALIVAGVIAIGVLLSVWLFLTSFYLPFTDDGSNSMFIGYAIWNMSSVAGQGPFVIFSALMSAALEIASFIQENLGSFVVLGVLCGGAFMWLEYHDQAIKTYLVFRQSGTRPYIDTIILPILNILRILFNVGVQFLNFFAAVTGFGKYGAQVVLLECTASTFSLTQLFGYVGTFLREVFNDFSTWIHDKPFEKDWSILNSLNALENILTAFIPTLDCFCRGLHFLWVYFATFVGMPSLHATINFSWLTFVNFFQIPLFALSSPNHRFDFKNITVHACAAVQSAGTFVEEGVSLTLENSYGLITHRNELPTGIRNALAIPYTSIITHPLCALFKVVNMTFNVSLNIDKVFDGNKTGVAYFQFGHVFDEIEVALLVFGDFGNLLNDDTQALINSVLLAIKDFIAFLFEWVIGSIFFEVTSGQLPASFGLFHVQVNETTSLQFWRYYFVDYWLKAVPLNTTLFIPPAAAPIQSPITLGNYTQSSALFDFFDNLIRANQSLGNLFGLINRVLGQAIKHLLNVVVGFIKFLANFLSYSFCVLTFTCDGMPITARDVDIDFLFNETLFFAGAAGDLFRQLDNASCTSIGPGEYNKTLVCKLGDVVTTSLDVLILVVREVFHFVQDILTVPTHQVKSCLFETQNVSRKDCLRIPDLTTAITELDDALCDLAYSVTGLIPISTRLNCTFAPVVNISDPRNTLEPPKPCSRVQTCLGYEFCSIVRFVPVILQIINTLFIRIYSGTFFSSIQSFIEYAISQLVNQFATVVEQFALFLDCFTCALKNVPAEGCTSPLYDFIKPIGNALRDLSRVFTGIFLRFVRIVLLFIVGFFSGNPITAIVDFVTSIVKDIFLGFLSSIVDFIAQLLDSIGLGFLGNFIKILYEGLCITLETIINIVIDIIRAFGSSKQRVSFCCSGGECTPSGNTRKRGGGLNDIFLSSDNQTMIVDIDNWLRLIEGQFLWQTSDACNASIYGYKDIGWTSLSDYEKGETMFCFAKLMWRHRDDGQTPLGNSTCDALVLENVDRNFKDLGLLEKREMMDCIQNRFFTDAIRRTFNITWLPQDLFTDPWRKYYFGLEIFRGYLIDYQFYNDRATLPVVILTPAYQLAWANMGLDTRHYDALKTEEDVLLFKASSHLKNYFIANNATQYDATLYTVTGIWSMADRFMSSLSNISLTLNDNQTDASVYLSYNSTLDNPIQQSARGLLAVISEFVTTLSGLTKFWKDPSNYKKRQDASDSLSYLASQAYSEAWQQIGLMMREWRNESALHNHTCATKEECDLAGVTAAREKYESFLRSDDSWVYQTSQWWSRLDLTTYPVANPRYVDHLVQPDEKPLTYVDASDGSIRSETRYERFWRYIALVRRGSDASRYRWAILTNVVEGTRDKVYTRILRKVYHHSVYVTTKHHKMMQTRYDEANPQLANVSISNEPRFKIVCLDDGLCLKEYNLVSPIVYDDDEADDDDNQDDEEFTITHRPGSTPLYQKRSVTVDPVLVSTVSVLANATISQFLVKCKNTITFPCDYPLECSGNATTTVCEQCLYLQAFIDRIISASEQLITYYSQGGRFMQSLDTATKFFAYTVDANARVVVGDSPSLQVGLFPRQGDGLWHTIVESMRYMGDDTPKKLRLNDFVASLNATTNATGGYDIGNETLFTREQQSGIHGMVLAFLVKYFNFVFEFLFRVFRTFVHGATSAEGIGLSSLLGRTLLICDWTEGHDLDGSMIRFSIGEVIIILGVIILFSDAVFGLLFGFNPLSIFLGTAIGGMIGMSIFLTLHSNWAYFCSPGLNVRLADDIFYFLAYNASPKCSWFWGFMFDSLYTNENCYATATIENAVFTHCVHKVGFYDLFYNIAFMLRFFARSTFDSLATDTGLLGVLGQVTFLNTRLAAYESLDLSDPFLWAKYMGCNFFVTLPADLIIIRTFTYVANTFLFPLVTASLIITRWFLEFVGHFIGVLYLVLMDILTNPGFDPLPPATYQTTQSGGDKEEEEEAAAATEDDSKKTKDFASRRMPRQESRLQRRLDAMGVHRLKNIWAYMRDRYQDLHED